MKNIIITGSNKGIGYGIAEGMAQRFNFRIILACRNKQLGQAAKSSILHKHAHSIIQVQSLDLSKQQSIYHFAENVRNKYGSLDILINNAGVYWKGDAHTEQAAEITFATNTTGPIKLVDQLLPLMNRNGKILNVTTSLAKFRLLKNKELVEQFKNIEKDNLLKFIQEYKTAVKTKTVAEKGYPASIYLTSKFLLNVYTQILGRQPEILQRYIQVSSFCPGFVKTDMTAGKGNITVSEAVKVPLKLIDLPFELQMQSQGGFFDKSGLSSI